VAALLRVHHGWTAALKGLPSGVGSSQDSDLWHGLSLLGFYVAPLALLGANFGYRSSVRKHVVVAALMGIALPLFGTLLLVGVAIAATYRAGFYRPSLSPNILLALWGGAADSAVPGPMLLAVITMFGAIRFGAMALADSLSVHALGRWLRWASFVPIVGVTVWASFNQYAPSLMTALAVSAGCLAVAGAVLTADAVIGKRPAEKMRKIDWVGVAALLAGFAVSLYMSHCVAWAPPDPWWHPWLLPSYGVAFLVCLCGRVWVLLWGGRAARKPPNEIMSS